MSEETPENRINELEARIREQEDELAEKDNEIIDYLYKLEQLEANIMQLEQLVPEESNKKRGKKLRETSPHAADNSSPLLSSMTTSSAFAGPLAEDDCFVQGAWVLCCNPADNVTWHDLGRAGDVERRFFVASPKQLARLAVSDRPRLARDERWTVE